MQTNRASNRVCRKLAWPYSCKTTFGNVRFTVISPLYLITSRFPVHGEIHARTCNSDHFPQGRLRNSWQHADGLFLFPKSSKQEQRSSQASVNQTAELIDQIFCHSNIAREQITDKVITKSEFRVEHPVHLVFVDDKKSGGFNGGSRACAELLSRHATLSKKNRPDQISQPQLPCVTR